MPTRDQYMQALRQADAQGDTEGAQRLAALMKADAQANATAQPAQPRITPDQMKAYIAAHKDDNSPLNDMNFGQKMLVGAGQAFNRLGQGAEQIYGNMFDKDLAARVAQERASNADADQALGKTWGGRIGNVLGNTAAAVPLAMGATMLGGAAAGATGIGALDSAITSGAVAGGAQGALQATDPGESRLKNAAVGAAFGGGIPAAGMAFKAVAPNAGSTARYLGSTLAGLVPGHTGRVLSAAMRAAPKAAAPELSATERAAAQNAARQDIGSEMGKVMNDQTVIPINSGDAARMTTLKNAYRNSLDKDTQNAMDQYILAGNNQGGAPANLIQKFRSNAIKDANAAEGKASNAYSEIQRELDGITDRHLNSQPQSLAQGVDGLSDAQRLSNLRNAYGQTFKGSPVDLSKVPGTTAYNTAQAVRAQALRKALADQEAQRLQMQAVQLGAGQQAAQ